MSSCAVFSHKFGELCHRNPRHKAITAPALQKYSCPAQHDELLSGSGSLWSQVMLDLGRGESCKAEILNDSPAVACLKEH